MTSFKENTFLPAPSVKADYDASLIVGYYEMSQRRVVIAGLARNLGGVVKRTMSRIEQLGELFADYRVVLFENDSKDKTLAELQAWAKTNDRVTILTEKPGDPINPSTRCLKRATRMANYRNTYRKYISSNLSDFDHVITVDTDLKGGWSLDGVANTFSRVDDWDFVGSNGISFRNYQGKRLFPCHFDVWAFRWRGTDRPLKATVINPKQWKRGQPFVSLNSCFGGMGVYRMEAMLRCSYDGSDCEHVPFHRKMREEGMDRIFMNPSQITLY